MVGVLSLSEAGADHAANEDAFVVRPHLLDPGLIVCFVADGQGGRAGGERAARLACDLGADAATRLTPDRLREPATWAGMVREIDRAVESDAGAGFTTVVGLCATADRVVGASSGDSAAVLVAGHTATELTKGQPKNPPVGSGAAGPAAFDSTANGPWRLLAITDGVWKYAGWGRVIDAGRHQRGAGLLAALDRAARLPGSGRFPDDFTVVLLESGPDG